LPGETKFSLYQTVQKTPCIDNRPSGVPGVAEIRKAYGIGVINNQEVGQPSDIVIITFKG
jgi:hypothetical protein